MAINDVVLLDGIIDERLAQDLPSSKRDEVFEFFSLEETLKDYDLSHEEIESGWIDGQNDGGFDGIYILINGHLLEDADDFVWPRAHASIAVWLITCKHHPTFRQATLDAMLATIQELFDLGRVQTELHGVYSEDLLAFRTRLELTLRRLSIGKHKRLIQASCSAAATQFGLSGIEVVGRREIERSLPSQTSRVQLSPEFIEQVHMLLPDQPWKPGVHIEVAEKLGHKPQDVTAAIQQLIAEGRRNRQVAGVVYDPTGQILASDPERVRNST